MVVGIAPETVGESMDVFYANKFELAEKANVAQRTSLKYEVYCYSNKGNTQDASFDGTFGLGVFDKEWNFVESLYEKSVKLGVAYGTSGSISFRYDSNTFTEGSQYYIALFAQHKDSPKPTRMRTPMGEGDYYLAKVIDGIVYLGENESMPEGLVGTFDVEDQNGSAWKVEVVKDANEEGKYIFLGIDPALEAKGLTANQNKVVGVMNQDGNIHLSNQQINGSYWLNNFSSTDDILVYVSRTDSTMIIRDTWGTIDKTNGETVSQYSSTNFHYPAPEPVVDDTVTTPSIYIDSEHRVQISCATEDASIYYSFSKNGTEPETLYTAPFVLQNNGVVKAVAKKNGKTSEVATEKEQSFVVAKPKIVPDDEHNVTIKCDTNDALIFYTTNGDKPTSINGQLYEGTFAVTETTTLMAVAVKENWNDSEIDTCTVIIIPEPLVIANNQAGQLSERIEYKDKLTATSLTVSGQLNGTDIKLILEMINDYRLAYVDLKGASIVAGGEPYYSTTYSSYSTEDNVIGQWMFYNCKGLMSMILPSTATKICQWAFWNCTNLALIELPEACSIIEDDAFYGNKNLSTLHLPKAVAEFGSDNLDGCPKFEALTVEEGNTVFKAIDGVLYKGDTVLVKFPMGKNSASFTVPAAVNRIENHAFSHANIESVKASGNLNSIGSYGFSNCENLKSVELPSSVQTIGNGTFWGCKQLEDVVLSENMEKLPGYVFYNCLSLRSVNIGPNIKDIAPDAFDNCTMLQSFIVDENNKAFASDGGILYTKDMKTLWRCPLALYSEELRLPESVTEINSQAFDRCVNIEKIVLGPNVKRIGSSAFKDCKMTAIYMPDGIESIGSMAFWGCANLETFVTPVNTKTISSNMFYNCKSLSYVYLSQGVKSIGDDAFQGCTSLSYVNSKIKDIEKVDVYYSTYSKTYTAFENLPDTCTWRVPAGPVNDLEKYANKYKEQPWWVSTWRISIATDVEPEVITLTANLQTYCSSEDLDFTGVDGLKAYIASGFSPSTGEVIMSRVYNVPAGTGLLLTGTERQSYEVPLAGTDIVYSNLLTGVLVDTEITDGYVLDDGTFTAVSGTQTVKSGEAYLAVTPTVNAPRLVIKFTDTENTGIQAVTADRVKSNAWYTLQGVRLNERPVEHGVYLHQGRKVVVK